MSLSIEVRTILCTFVRDFRGKSIVLQTSRVPILQLNNVAYNASERMSVRIQACGSLVVLELARSLFCTHCAEAKATARDHTGPAGSYGRSLSRDIGHGGRLKIGYDLQRSCRKG